ncbi:MAG: transglutaminase domain-containing protein [Deltaproteobacteria bacterium]|nr:transglutaminase domain-containing protein [Deltaproteobacteria bacterium]
MNPTNGSSRVVSSCFLLLLAFEACAPPRWAPRTEAVPLDPEVHAELLALGAVDREAEPDPLRELARLERIARRQLALGNDDLAAVAARREVSVARRHLAASSGGADAEAARDAYRDAQQTAIELGDRLADASLVLFAVGDGSGELPAEELARAMAGLWTSGPLPGPVWETLDDAGRARAERAGAVPEGATPLDASTLVALGDLGRQVLERRLREAIDLADAASTAQALLALDPWHLTALAVTTLAADPDASPDIGLAGVSEPERTWQRRLAQLTLLHRVLPGREAPLLALAVHCLRMLPGDAYEAARELEAETADPKLRDAAAVLAALAALRAGRAEEWDALGSRLPAATRAPWVLREAGDVGPWPGGPAGPLAGGWELAGPPPEGSERERAVRAARRTLVELGTEEWEALLEVSSDSGAPRELRERALAELHVRDPSGARVAGSCLADGLSDADCRERRDAWWAAMEGELITDEETGFAAQLERLPIAELSAYDAASAVGWVEDDDLPAAREWLERVAATRLGSTGPVAAARIRLALSAGDTDRARELLAADGDLLSPIERVVYGAWLADAASGIDVEPEAAGQADLIGGFASGGAGAGTWAREPATPGPGRLAWLAAVARTLGREDPSPAVPQLLELAREFTGEEAALLATHAGLLARTAGDEDALAEARAIAARAQPDGLGAWLLSVSPTDAAERRVVLGDLRADRAAGLLVAADEDADPARAAALLAATIGGDVGRSLVDLVGDGTLDRVAELRAAVQYEPLSRLDLPPAATARLADGIGAGAAWVADAAVRQVLAADDAGQAVELARRAAPHLLALLERGADPGSVATLAILAGDAAAEARAAGLVDPRAGPREPLSADHAAVLVAPVRDRVDDELAWAVVQAMEGGRTPTDDVLAAADALPPDDDAARLSCRLHALAERIDATFERCGALYERTGDPLAGMLLGWATATAGEVSAAAHGVDVDELFAHLEASAPTALLAPTARNHSVVLQNRGRIENAAYAELVAQAAGLTANELYAGSEGQARWLGPLARYLAGGDSTFGALVNRALFALADGSVRAAGIYLAQAASLGGEGVSIAERELGQTVQDVSDCALSDVDAGRLDRAAVADWEALRSAGFAGPGAEAFAEAHPDTCAVRFAALSRAFSASRFDDALAILEDLPDDELHPTLLAIGRLTFALHGRSAELDGFAARARERYPDDPRLRLDAPLPDVLASPDAFAAAAAEADAATAALQPGFWNQVSLGAEVALPAGAELLARGLGARFGGLGFFTTSEPRTTSCAGEECVDQVFPRWASGGLTRVWSGPVRLPAGLAHRVLLRLDGQALLVTTLPLGSRIYALVALGSLDAVAANSPLLRLVERSFRPLDVVRGAHATMALRNLLDAEPPWDVRLAADDAFARDGGGDCPAAELLEAQSDDRARLGLLLTSYLTTADGDARLRILRCAEGLGPERAVLGVAALGDLDARARDLGAGLAAADDERATEAARALLRGGSGPALAGREHMATTDPPLGMVHTLLGLPGDARSRLAAELFASDRPEERLLAVAAEAFRPGLLSRDELRRAVREGTVVQARQILELLDPFEPGDLAALRDRLDRLPAPASDEERWLTLSLVEAVAGVLDRRDDRRLRRIAGLPGIAGACEARSPSCWLALRVDSELDRRRLARGRGEPEDAADARNVEWLRGRKAVANEADAAPGIVARLGTEPLPRSLPGRRWTYVRIPQPDLFIETMLALYERLEAPTAAGTALVRLAFALLAKEYGADDLGPDGGIDLAQPAECATADAWPSGWVCTVGVRDRDRVRSTLAPRGPEENHAAALALGVGRLAVILPIGAGTIPMVLTRLLREPRAGEEPPELQDGGLAVSESACTPTEVGGVTLERCGTVRVRERGPATVSGEYVLFAGDRLVVFSNLETARAVLLSGGEPDGTLAEDGRFAALAADWSPAGAALQLARVGSRGGDDLIPLSVGDLEADAPVDDRGMVVGIRIPAGDGLADAGSLPALLPPDAPAAFALGLDDADRRVARRELDEAAEDRPLEVAERLIDAAGAGAFAWLPDDAPRGWQRWVGAFRLTEHLEAALAGTALEPPPDGELECTPAVCFARDGSPLVVGADEFVVREALARTDGPGAAEYEATGFGRLDGARVGAAFSAAAGALAADDQRRLPVEMFAVLLESMGDISFDAHTREDGALLELDARFRPRLADVAFDVRLVDNLLGSGRNALPLPHAATAADRAGAVRYVLRVDDAADVAARAFPDARRTTARPIAADRLEIVVRPESSEEEPLSASERQRLTSGDAELGLSAPEIAAKAAELRAGAADDAAVATAIVEWVHRNVAYELTAEELDAPSVLARHRGDCSEHARLAVALLRAAGLPAELRSGLVLSGSELAPHAWAAWHDGRRWRETDPTTGAASVDARYLPASMFALLALLSLQDVAVEEFGPAP